MSIEKGFNPEAEQNQDAANHFEIPANIIEKSADHQINVERAVKLVRLFEAVEER